MTTYQAQNRRSISKRRSAAKHETGAKRRLVPEEMVPHIHKEAEKLLREIGKPEPSPFVPDPFQVEALAKIRNQDVLVSAPTGSGKTWIALEATKQCLADGRGSVWYATPLKALSNAKYEEFGEALGRDNVGILTGDRKENIDAPVVVGTTEILRNQLYDAMHVGSDVGVDLVILDEAHYLGDVDRGVVWEEVLIYLPTRVKVLLLSATISNSDAVAKWLSHIRRVPCAVVHSADRPVPLHALFLAPDGHLTPFLRGKRFFPEVAEIAKEEKGRKGFKQFSIDVNDLIGTLREFDLLPAIVFLKSRADCDKSLEKLLPAPERPGKDFMRLIEDFLKLYPELKSQKQLERLMECKAGAHHAGHLPAWRLLIEKMMGSGHLEAIFSTSTVAAGVNFPARTVVLLQSDRFNGRVFMDMSATELHQMTGRAGRRGKDNVGFALVVPGRFLNLFLVKQLLMSEPEPLESRISVNFSMTLNLLLSHDPDGIRKLLGHSFAAFRENPKRAAKVNSRLVKDFQKHLAFLQDLEYVDKDFQPTHDGKLAARLRLDHPLLIAELIRNGELSELSPEELAALIAPFVMDKDKEILISRELWQKTRSLWKKFRKTVQSLKNVAQFMIIKGFNVPPIMFWPAASVFLWAHDVEWSELTENVGADEGDLAMLVLRTADHLRQLLSLEDEEPELAETARKALAKIMKTPVI